VPANAYHKKRTQCNEKNCLANPAFSNPDFLSNMRDIGHPCTENKTEAGIEESRSKIFFILEEKFY
jgi:hypothetical protein